MSDRKKVHLRSIFMFNIFLLFYAVCTIAIIAGVFAISVEWITGAHEIPKMLLLIVYILAISIEVILGVGLGKRSLNLLKQALDRKRAKKS